MVVVIMRDEYCVAAGEVGYLAREIIEAAGAGPCCWAGADGEYGVEKEVEASVRRGGADQE